MLLQEIREQIVDYGMKLIETGLTVGTAGNISMFDPETGLMAISPSGIPYEKTRPEDVVLMDLTGKVADGNRKPSSEYGLHAVFYQEKPEARAAVHAHSMYCTTLACSGEPLRAVHYAIADAGVATLPLVPYHTFGTEELAEAVRDALRASESKALLLANHGMITWGTSIESAFSLAQTAEWCAEVQWRSMAIGRPCVLSDADMAAAVERYKNYGQKREDGKKTSGYFS